MRTERDSKRFDSIVSPHSHNLRVSFLQHVRNWERSDLTFCLRYKSFSRIDLDLDYSYYNILVSVHTITCSNKLDAMSRFGFSFSLVGKLLHHLSV